MHLKPHQQTDLLIYEEIASGRLNPRLPASNELHFLKNLVVFANTKTFCTCRIDDDPAKLIKNFDITELGYQFKEDAEIVVKQDTDLNVSEIIARPVKIYLLEDHFHLPVPPDKKSNYFLALISDEFERLKIRANKVLKSTRKKKHLALFAHKNIQRAKKIQYDLQYMLSKYMPWSASNNDPDAYVIYVLDIFVSRIITFYQKFFEPFILAYPKKDHNNHVLPAIPLYLKHPYLFQDTPQKSEEYNFHLDGSIFDHQFMRQVDKLKDLSEPDPGFPVNSAKLQIEKKSLQQEQGFGEGIRLKWHGQLNVLVDVMLQLTSSAKCNGRPPLEATPDELRLFIHQHFLDRNGREISPYTLDTYLKPARDDKRLHPDSPKRIDLSAFLNNPESGKM